MKRKTMKRIFSIILAVCMLLSIAPITMAADTAYGGLKKGDNRIRFISSDKGGQPQDNFGA